jgi:hypothetical protein
MHRRLPETLIFAVAFATAAAAGGESALSINNRNE